MSAPAVTVGIRSFADSKPAGDATDGHAPENAKRRRKLLRTEALAGDLGDRPRGTAYRYCPHRQRQQQALEQTLDLRVCRRRLLLSAASVDEHPTRKAQRADVDRVMPMGPISGQPEGKLGRTASDITNKQAPLARTES